MKGFQELTRVEDAVSKLRSTVSHKITDIEEVYLASALWRVCGKDVYSPTDSPAYDRSAVDGYALIAEDTFGASATNPVRIRVIGRIEVGADPSKLPKINRGEATEIMTGAPIPPGASAVIPLEHARLVENFIEVYDQVHPYQNISRRGEDYSRGSLVLRRGWIIKPWHIGALASLGIRRVNVLRKPIAALLSTGGELVELNEKIRLGKVYNSTKPMLAAMLANYGADPVDLGTAPDDPERIAEKISEGLKTTDMIIVTGGTSVGARDLVPEAISRLGQIIVHGLAIRPGKPAGFAISSGKPIFMLSGFPVAALIGFQALVIPALEEMLGCRFDPPPRIRGRLTRRVTSPPGVRSYVRVRAFRSGSGEVLVEPLRVTGSGVLSTLTLGNGLLVIPEDLEGFDEGDEVEVILLSPIIEGGEGR